ncbi:MAG: 5,10-methylenetetrahydrofolate reductase [Actinomycetota bacterium]
MTGRFGSRRSTAESARERHFRLQLISSLTYEIVPLASVDAAIDALPPTSPVSVTCSPVKGIEATVELTDRLRALGHRPIPHLAARMVDGPAQVARLAHWLRTEDIGQVFLVGGDATPPAGPYHDATTFLRALLDADPGLHTIGVTAYPDGHPLIAPGELDEALLAKQQVLDDAGLAGYASTQMCFDPQRIDDWLQGQRRAGLHLGVHLGLAGVVERAKLLTMGVRLGVGTSLSYLRKNRSALTQLLTSSTYDPNSILGPMSPVLEVAGVTGVHCFTFNQVAATAAWQKRTLETS